MRNLGQLITLTFPPRFVDAILKRWGSTTAKRRVWDCEYSAGKWDYLGTQHAPCDRDLVYSALEPYCANGTILDLACGPGATPLELPDTYTSYVGVDISPVAIAKAAAQINRHPSRAKKITLVAADLLEFTPSRTFKIILFRECLYYFPIHRLRQLLARYSAALEPDGVFVARLHDRNKFNSIITMIESEYAVVSTLGNQNVGEVVIVFRPRFCCDTREAI
jgi:SAM-dependent methyltransferase